MERGEGERAALPDIRVPAGWTFAGLVGGLALGLLLAGSAAQARLAPVAAAIGGLWLHALQMTIVPLVAGLLFTGVVQLVAAAEGGAMARRTLALIFSVLAFGGLCAALLMPPLLDRWPIPPRAVATLSGHAAAAAGAVPGFADFVAALVPENVIDAAAKGAMLPLVVFVVLFALAATRLPAAHRRALATLFEALAGAMMVVIGWVLAVAPAGVFALAFGVAAGSGVAAVAALAHYIALVAGMGGIVLLAAYPLVAALARVRVGAFARALLPLQALAISTQSSLACLPAMLAACRRLTVRETTAEFVLPLAVTLFRATGPAMNLAVAIYAARLTGTPLTATSLAIGFAVAMLTTIASVSLPGAISFVSAIAPIALAMGVPIAPLGLLVAVEMLPDLMRTVGNVTLDVALAAMVDASRRDAANAP